MKKSLQMLVTRPESEANTAVFVKSAQMNASVLVVCEHASNHIPSAYSELGIDPGVGESHVAWDPGALGVAKVLANEFSAPLIAGGISRLVYDCNRPPDAASAIPEKSEVYDIPGNKDLTKEERAFRVASVYEPFRKAVANEVRTRRRYLRLLVTVHSFTPIYNGHTREVEIGVLHGIDRIFANAMINSVPENMPYTVRLNEPYSANDGVAHTLDVHGARNALPNVMLEIRNDLIRTPEDQQKMGQLISDWIAETLEWGLDL